MFDTLGGMELDGFRLWPRPVDPRIFLRDGAGRSILTRKPTTPL
jgi:hypothetical protein